MKPVEVVLRRRERERRRMIVNTYVNITLYPLYNYYVQIKSLKIK
jgi:hypothetical protein